MEDVKRMMDAAKKAFDPALIQTAIMPAAMIIRDEAKRGVKLGAGRRPSGEPREYLRHLIFATKGKRGVPDVIVGVSAKKAPHAHLVEFGTSAHRISPRPPKTLLFIPALMKFVPFIRHPGAKKKPFLRPAVRASKRRVAAKMEDGLRKLLDRQLPKRP